MECNAWTLRIDHPVASYGIFCFNKDGDLFLNSDFGPYMYAWRSFGEDFPAFLSRCNAEYIVGKFEMSYREMRGKKLPKHWLEMVTLLVTEFIRQLKYLI